MKKEISEIKIDHEEKTVSKALGLNDKQRKQVEAYLEEILLHHTNKTQTEIFEYLSHKLNDIGAYTYAIYKLGVVRPSKREQKLERMFSDRSKLANIVQQ